MKPLRLLLTVIGVLGLLLTTGCWNRRELNDLAIAVGIGLDKADKGYQLSVQVVDSNAVASKKGGGGGAAVSLYQIEAASVYEAVRKLTTISPRRIYPSHLRVLIFGEELAREGIANTIDLIARDWELRSDFYMTIARDDKAENVLKVLTPIEQIPANKLFSSLKTSERIWAPTRATRLDDFINDYLSEGKEAIISGIKVIGDANKANTTEILDSTTPAARLRYSNLAVFKEDRLIGWLNEDESKGYNYITNNVDNTVGPIACPDQPGVINLEILRTTTKMIGSIQNGKPVIDIHLNSVENIGEVECTYDVFNADNIKVLEKLAADRFTKLLEASVKRIQKTFKSDVFGFGDAIHRADKQYWKLNKERWSDIFPSVEVRYHAEIKIREMGTMNNSILHKKKEITSSHE